MMTLNTKLWQQLDSSILSDSLYEESSYYANISDINVS